MVLRLARASALVLFTDRLRCLMKRPVRLLGSAALLVSIWMVIFEAGLRMQQYFGPLYDLEMANVNLDWESDVVNHQPVSQNQNLCFYGDLTGFTYKRVSDANGVRIIDDEALLAGCRDPVSVLFLGNSFMEGYDDANTLPYHVAKYFRAYLHGRGKHTARRGASPTVAQEILDP